MGSQASHDSESGLIVGVNFPIAHVERLTRPLARFLHIEYAGGLVLAICTIVALAIANSSLNEGFQRLWETKVALSIGSFKIEKSLLMVINDGLMTLFFFVVGLEIKRELVAGELSSPAKAALPVIGALGGMIAPALLYLLIEMGEPGESGWGIPMATDIAFVVGVLGVFGRKLPAGLKIFLLSLAIADDIGAVLVIALAYTSHLSWLALGLASAGFGVTYLLNRLGVRSIGIYVLIGMGIWFAVLKSGVHPTIAGVLLGLLTPSSAWVGTDTLRKTLTNLIDRMVRAEAGEATPISDKQIQQVAFAAKESVSPLVRLELSLHPWVAYVIMPLFALANAGVTIHLAAIQDRLSLAIILGLVVGKPVGIFLLSFLAVRYGIAQLPVGVTWLHLLGAACLGGIGFTMSLFIAGLALPEALLAGGKTGILIGSLISAALGFLLLSLSIRQPSRSGSIS